MKHRYLLPLLALLLLSTNAALATPFFPDGDILHRDPFCARRELSEASYFAAAVSMTDPDVIVESGEYILCADCMCPLPNNELQNGSYYYNPNGGMRLHSDPDCPGVSAKYKPLVPVTEDMTHLLTQPCSFCWRPADLIGSSAQADIWNATTFEKAGMLPGVWTAPSSRSISEENAYAIARCYLTEHYPDVILPIDAMHYDHGVTRDDGRETYRVLATTALRIPVCVIYIDAVTGEVYRVQPSADMR